MRNDHRRRTVRALLVLAALTAACAARTPAPPPVTTRAHPEFIYPAIPAALQRTFAAERVDLGWRYLQIDDLRGADREFAAALKSDPKMYPGQAGQGYVALVRRDFDRAVASFDASLRSERSYVPALVGRGQALLALGRDGEALTSFEAALAADPSLGDVRQRAEVLRFRGLQDLITTARTAAAAGRTAEARSAYERAVAASPESAFLHRELGILERRAGNPDRALAHLERATALDPLDSAAFVQQAELFESRADFARAAAAYRRAIAVEPSADLDARLAAVTTRAREAALPPEFTAALSAAEITRGDLAALIAVRLEPLLGAAPVRQVVMTDTRGHWAAEWIGQVAAADIIAPFENHTFQPDAIVRRGDLAIAVGRLLALAASGDSALRSRLAERPAIADMTPRHIQYAAAASAVASGVMPLLEGDRFQPGRVVSGREAADALERVQKLAPPSSSGAQ